MLETLKEEGFNHINPSVPVWIPTEGDTIRGYILARQFDRNEDAFYVLQLTHDWTPDADDTEEVLPAGSLVAVFEAPTIGACQRLLPNYQRVTLPQGEMQVASYAFEVVMTAGQQTQFGYPDAIEVAARRIEGASAVPSIQQPPASFTYPTMTKRALVASRIAAAADTNTTLVEVSAEPSADAPANGV